MFVWIILGSVAVPALMTFLHVRRPSVRQVWNAASVIAGLVFGNVAAMSVYTIIKDQTVFMTNIHAVFLNPLFLASGAYLGVFLLYRLMVMTMESYKGELRR